LVGILVRTAAVLAANQSGLGGEHLNIARALATDWSFADAYGTGTGATAHTMPIHPLLLSFVTRLFGGSPFEEHAYQIFCSLLSAIGYSLLPHLAVAGGLGRQVGIVGGLAGALLPVNFFSQSGGVFDGPTLVLAILGLMLMYTHRVAEGRFDVPSGIQFGLASGVGCLVSASVIPVIAAWVLVSLLRCRQQKRALLGFAAATTVCATLVLAPWAARNHFVLGQWIWTRSNLGLELQVSNNDLATADLEYNVRQPWFHSVHPHGGKEEAGKVQRMGEPAYNRAKMSTALAWISTHKDRFVALTLQRIWLFWVPNMLRPLQSVFEVLLTVFGLAGLALAMRRKVLLADLAACAFLAYPAIFYFIHTSPRHRYPIEPLLFLFSAYSVCSIWRQIVRGTSSVEQWGVLKAWAIRVASRGA
jgi:hypothetical protein